MSKDGKDKEMICGLTADEHEVLRRELRALPETMPPRIVWNRIREQAEAEGLIGRRPMRRPLSWQGGIGLAAAVALAAVLVAQMHGSSKTALPTGQPTAAAANGSPVSTLQALMVESRQLETDLRALPAQPRVQRLGTAATISDIEDRIAAIDYQLNDPEVVMKAGDEEIFWRERVRLMKLLVRLRYAQAQRTAF